MLSEMFCKTRHTMVEVLEQLDSLESHYESKFGCKQYIKNCMGDQRTYIQ